MKQYLDLLRDVRDNGVDRPDRTGTGTRGVFGRQIRFNLEDGFPLLTTKKLHTRSIFHELLWFLKGETNIKYLQDNNVKIWDKWADEKGDLGPIYGHEWRNFGGKPSAIQKQEPKLRDGIPATYLGVGNGEGRNDFPSLKKTWEGMMARCYDKNSIEYNRYGGRGVHVCDAWLEFRKFGFDVQDLPGWEDREKNPRGYALDKDGIGTGFIYSPKSCQWVTHGVNARLKSKFLYTVEKDGEKFEFRNPTVFCREVGIDDGNFSDLWTDPKIGKMRHGYTFVSKIDETRGIDQISNLIEGIKKDPNGRRHIVTAWNPIDIPKMALPPCHCLFQFFVADGKLSCQLYQRSADIFLGVPFNIASYALLTRMVAQVVDLQPGEFVHTFGDLHLYKNHFDQADEQLTRKPSPLPNLKLNPKVKDIFEFKMADIGLWNYDPQESIKAPIAV